MVGLEVGTRVGGFGDVVGLGVETDGALVMSTDAKAGGKASEGVFVGDVVGLEVVGVWVMSTELKAGGKVGDEGTTNLVGDAVASEVVGVWVGDSVRSADTVGWNVPQSGNSPVDCPSGTISVFLCLKRTKYVTIITIMIKMTMRSIANFANKVLKDVCFLESSGGFS